MNQANPRLGFPPNTQSVANALYSAIELSLAAISHDQIQKEVDALKRNMQELSRQQYKKVKPDANFAYEVEKTRGFKYQPLPSS
ncbi:KilA-N domain-containing protein [Caenorhabditis elegans]|uniref:KilA-N domain-containing protein n=1 Tax=Caenorhabditis elegans TaxID=6239 RepID=E4MVD5_CAEEL|nr:KilA-N domain-containing protein [Caenorhabditis elegans]CCD71321.2 KilA-N domain-containing protein [Caenorhabditis elegans]|eukprot:NP_001343668.1 Uncharacterized protein CELE_F46E10.18 [Caenorhabditis elegans]